MWSRPLAPEAASRRLRTLGAVAGRIKDEDIAEVREKARIDDERIAQLERAIDDGDRELEPLRAFILPGGTPKSAALHVAAALAQGGVTAEVIEAPNDASGAGLALSSRAGTLRGHARHCRHRGSWLAGTSRQRRVARQ